MNAEKSWFKDVIFNISILTFHDRCSVRLMMVYAFGEADILKKTNILETKQLMVDIDFLNMKKKPMATRNCLVPKYFKMYILCSTENRNSYWFVRMWGWVNGNIFIYGWNIPLNTPKKKKFNRQSPVLNCVKRVTVWFYDTLLKLLLFCLWIFCIEVVMEWM